MLAVASCKPISHIKGRKDEQLLKLMNDAGIQTNGVESGIRRCLVTIRCHPCLHAVVTEQNTKHTAPTSGLGDEMKEVIWSTGGNLAPFPHCKALCTFHA